MYVSYLAVQCRMSKNIVGPNTVILHYQSFLFSFVCIFNLYFDNAKQKCNQKNI